MTLRPHLTFAAVLLLFLGCVPRSGPAVSSRPSAKLLGGTAGCTTPTPHTAAGFTAMFGRVDPVEYEVSDGYMSRRLPDGRTVWFFGDTVAAGWVGMHHSTAMVQAGGCLHVSDAGAQLLPDEPDGSVYWIGRATVLSNTTVYLYAARVQGLTQLGTAKASVQISAAGDLTFGGWLWKTTSTTPLNSGSLVRKNNPGWGEPFGTYLYRVRDGAHVVNNVGPVPIQTVEGSDYRFSYNAESHPEFTLTSGRMLVSLCWNTWHMHADLSLYRPSWYEVPR